MKKFEQQLKLAEEGGFKEIVIPVEEAKAIYDFIAVVEYEEKLSDKAEGYLDTLLRK